jgi:RNA polymerase sigma-70 factor (ECF subfamily)
MRSQCVKVSRTDETDNELWEGVKADSKQAFEMLFNRYYDTLCLYANSFLNNHSTSEEITTQVFYKLWQNRDRILINYAIKPYLFRCIFNACSDFLEQNKTAKQYKFVEIDNQILDLIDPDENYIFEYLEGVEVEKDVMKAIDTLPKQCKEIFCLSRFELMTYNQISERLNISVNTVKTQICRALDSLRVQLDKYLVQE